MDPRVTGEQRYAVEVERPGMLHAAFVRSPHAHARVVSVAAPDGVTALLPDDVADLGRYGCQVKDQRVLADADYASDPPAMLAALGARAVLRSPRGARSVTIGELIRGYYETCIESDELLVEVRVPPQPERAVYRKFRSRSSEDRPCVSVAATRGDAGLRVVVGAVAGTPQDFPELCDGSPAQVAAAYAERIEPLTDARGSAAYRRRVIAAEVRRAVEAVS